MNEPNADTPASDPGPGDTRRAASSRPGTGLEGAIAGMLVLVCLVGISLGVRAVASSPTEKLPAPGSVIKADLSEWKIDTPTHLKAGVYTYDISNTGAMEHEMLVMKTDLAPSALPMKNGDINEDALPPISDGDNIAPGKSQTRTIDLSKPGTYLFVCNIPGHFKEGMYTYVTVDPAPASVAATALPASGSTINAVLSEWKVLTPTQLPTGSYNYHITNVGTMEHEMLVMKTDLAANQLPMKGGDINEDALVPMSDGPNIAPGGSQNRKIDLTKPGTYLFVCNIPGHFKQGMYTYVTVKPRPVVTTNAVLSEWKIVTPTVVKPGVYTYHMTNVGTMEHEMLVMKTDLPANKLPMKNGDINEDALPPISDGENIPPGKSQDRKIDLSKPGTYLFVCNIPGHFKQGMYTYVTVR